MIKDIRNMRITKKVKNSIEINYTPKNIVLIQGEFLKGPIPLEWLNKTFSLHKRTILTVLSIWHLYELQRRPFEFKYSYSMALKFGLKRTSAWRGLLDLKGLNLITIKNIKGSSPLISIVMNTQYGDA